jgi:hypothetical protein
MKNPFNFFTPDRQFTFIMIVVLVFIAVVVFNAVSYGCVNTIASH